VPLCGSNQMAEPLEKVIGPPAATNVRLGLDPAIQLESQFLSPTLPSKSPAFLRSPRNVPAQIDAAAASMSPVLFSLRYFMLIYLDRPFFPVDQLTPQSAYSNYSDGRSSVLGTPSTQVTTPSSMFSRKPVWNQASRTPSPPSPNLASNLDSAFPYFPLKKNEESRPREATRPYGAEETMVPPSPGVNILQRMNTIAPGPFGAQRVRQTDKSTPGSQPLQMQRNVSANSSTQKLFRNQEGREHFRKASNSSSLKSQESVRSDRSIDRMRGRENANNKPIMPTSRPRRPTDTVDRFLDELSTQSDIGTPSMMSPESRSRTFPETQQSRLQPPVRSAIPPPSAPPSQTEFFPNRGYDDSQRPGTSAGPGRGYGGFTMAADPAVQPSFESQISYNPYKNQPAAHAPMSARSRARTVTRPSNATEAPESDWFERPRPSPTPPSEAFKPSFPPVSNPSGIISAPFSSAARGRSKTVTRPSGPSEIPRFDRRLDEAPPLPYSTPLVRQPSNQSQRSDRYHAPSDSNSSYASSASTAPTSDGSAISRSGSSSEDKSGGFRSQREPPPFIRTELPIAPRAPGGFFSSPESPTDPAIQRGVFREEPRLPMKVSPPRIRPERTGYGQGPRLPMDVSPPRNRPEPPRYGGEPPRYGGEPRLPTNISPPRNRLEQPRYNPEPRLPQSTSPPRNRTEQIPYSTNNSPPRKRPDPVIMPRSTSPVRPRQQVTKPPCRSCSLPIYGRGVKAADSQLTGRFHKECFVCKTCSAPFPTGEFYVLSNAPYCATHYHELNNSVCRSCNKGIEGRFLETDGRDKYHESCFSCERCGVTLRDDYYESGGRVLCERHVGAFQMGMGGGRDMGRAPPEKRRTKLMMI
jgi:hypothetical protein